MTATRFDPRNYVVFLGTGVLLTHYAKDIDSADEMLQEGTRNNPNNPKLWVQLGYNAYFVRGNAELAADYWKRAALLPNAPRYLGALAALARYQSGSPTEAIKVAEELLGASESGFQRDYMEITLKELKSELRLEEYDDACLRYRQATGEWPAEPWVLQDQGYTSDPPIDFFDHPIYLDIDDEADPSRRCIARSDGVGSRQFERAEELIGSQKPEDADEP